VEAASHVTDLVLGPLLRHVGPRDATIWVETSAACVVEVRAGSATASDRTFHVAGHHYAIVAIDGLEPGSATPYEVLLDGERAWPADARQCTQFREGSHSDHGWG